MPKIEGDLENALRLLHGYFAEKHISFALVGALVPALLLPSEVGARETRDADHVIKLASWADWEVVIADLVSLGFTRGREEQEHRLCYGRAEIDLIPYGITGGPEEVLVWRRSGNRMNMTGFSDVFQCAIQIEVAPGLTLPIVPLWLFAVLKVIAYVDRQFPRDLSDLVHVMERYDCSGAESRRFEIAGAVESVTYEDAGAYLLGRDIREKASPQALRSVKEVIESIDGEYHPIINTILREENRTFAEDRRRDLYKLIEGFRQGLS